MVTGIVGQIVHKRRGGVTEKRMFFTKRSTIGSKLETLKFNNVKSQADERVGGVAGKEMFFWGRIIAASKLKTPKSRDSINLEGAMASFVN